MRVESQGRGGLAAAALGFIVLVTIAWWWLALYPATAALPEWVQRTRDVCFGTMENGLPGPGGWVLLIGEPIGMVLVLLTVWGGNLRADLRALWATVGGRVVVLGAVGLVMWSAHLAGRQISRVLGAQAPVAAVTNRAQPLRAEPRSLRLVDQHGTLWDMATLDGPGTIVTFAFGHCETVCPTIVREIRAARERAGAQEIPLVVVTVDPWRDTPSRLAHMAMSWELRDSDRVLSGAVDEVLGVLGDWGVQVTRDPNTGEVAHPALVVVTGSRRQELARFGADRTGLEDMLRRMVGATVR